MFNMMYQHSTTVNVGGEPVPGNPFTVYVTGVPSVVSRVTEGPDWHQRKGYGDIARGNVCMVNGDVQNVYEGRYGWRAWRSKVNSKFLISHPAHCNKSISHDHCY